ncbi:dCTP deaminase [Candidatus Obscuribacterales bacterium]|jgi:dCTP deaminase|nr:dCTP deaminase [Candidatus Obscuribacterales bacterium]MBX3137322.1 dCTP deaminase [Candidatus Obscuribacterales bacterium]MBX3152963.1 dCTP deaminase [Candidatus Obscuribacterales bacterium]
MSILVDHEIREEIRSERLIIEPFDDSLIQPNSIDVRLADRFSWHENGDGVIDPYKSESVLEGLVHVVGDSIVIQPHQFVLGATLEKVCLPDDIVGQLTGKSSLARLGVMVHVTAGFIDAGFSNPPAQITLEIVNVGNRPVRLHAGMCIAQMVFTRTARCEVPYNLKPSAKYNGQPAAAHSRYYLNSVSG